MGVYFDTGSVNVLFVDFPSLIRFPVLNNR